MKMISSYVITCFFFSPEGEEHHIKEEFSSHEKAISRVALLRQLHMGKRGLRTRIRELKYPSYEFVDIVEFIDFCTRSERLRFSTLPEVAQEYVRLWIEALRIFACVNEVGYTVADFMKVYNELVKSNGVARVNSDLQDYFNENKSTVGKDA